MGEYGTKKPPILMDARVDRPAPRSPTVEGHRPQKSIADLYRDAQKIIQQEITNLAARAGALDSAESTRLERAIKSLRSLREDMESLEEKARVKLSSKPTAELVDLLLQDDAVLRIIKTKLGVE